mmetsp:Transcript_11814/g.41383  ORF Transcript_11814/g.41383 Transcript_11814/m.41383 type:complete len:272 (-) Transcript_11814:698-1513(-)
MSRCSSPMPWMIVSPLSLSTNVRNVGSSLVKRLSALANASCCCVVLGFTEYEMTGSGTNIEVIASMGPSVKVSPLWQSTPNMATISPAPTESMSSISSACMRTSRGVFMRCRRSTLVITLPRCSVPWYTRRYVSCPNRLSSSLNASATSAWSLSVTTSTLASSADRSSAKFLISVGLGRYCTTPSSSGCTPLFLKAEPMNTGQNSSAMVARRMAPCSCSGVGSSSMRKSSPISSSTSARRSTSSCRFAAALSASSAGTGFTRSFSPKSPSK